MEGLAERLCRTKSLVELGLRVADPDALACGEAVGLHDARRAGDGERPRGRHAGRRHDVLREGLGALDLRRLAPGAEDRDASMPQLVGEACHERRLRTDDDEVDAQLRGRGTSDPGSSARTGWQLASAAIPGLPGAACSSPSEGLRDSAPRERVLAAARTHEEHLHAADPMPVGAGITPSVEVEE
jgi:hypothetical protein